MDEQQAKALREPFPDSLIGHKPKAGIMLAYVGHAATTDRLLKVDPTWSWEPLALDEFGLPAMDKAGNLWIRLTVAGVTRIGCGDGPSMKERIGDAIRNAAMRYGVALDLWAKEDLLSMEEAPAGNVGSRTMEVIERARGGYVPSPQDAREVASGPLPVPETRRISRAPKDAAPLGITQPQLGKMGAMMSELNMKDREQALEYVGTVIGREISSRNDLTRSEAGKVIDALEELLTLQGAK